MKRHRKPKNGSQSAFSENKKLLRETTEEEEEKEMGVATASPAAATEVSTEATEFSIDATEFSTDATEVSAEAGSNTDVETTLVRCDWCDWCDWSKRFAHVWLQAQRLL